MQQLRVVDLARTMGISPKELIFKLRSIGVSVSGEEDALDLSTVRSIITGETLQKRPREVIVRQGEPGRSMFVLVDGAVRVTVEPGQHEVARLGPGACFGEMSLLTGDARSATVAAAGDCRVIEITDEMLRALAEAKPSIVDRLGEVAFSRRQAPTLRPRSARWTAAIKPAMPPPTMRGEVAGSCWIGFASLVGEWEGFCMDKSLDWEL